MSTDLINMLNPESLRALFQDVGYRVETLTEAGGATMLRSATGGMAFDIRFANQLVGGDGYADVVFLAGLEVQGSLPAQLINGWNSTRRFGRLHLDKNILVFTMDVSVVGGVTATHVRAQIEIWDRLLQDMIAYLRSELRDQMASNGAQPPAALSGPASEPAQSSAA